MEEKMEEFKSEARQEHIEESMFNIAFTHDGKEYKGWARPSGGSWHVVLNGVFFGDLSFNNDEWTTNSQREHTLVQKVGEQLATFRK